MDKSVMKERTKTFALRVIAMVDNLPQSIKADTLGRQALRSATSVGANYRAALRARSRAEFIAKLGVVLEEVDETAYWLELIIESGLMKEERLTELRNEADELCAILFKSISSSRDEPKN